MTQEETEYLNKSIPIKQTDFVIKDPFHTKSSFPDVFISEINILKKKQNTHSPHKQKQNLTKY